MDNETDYQRQRNRMVALQLEERDIFDRRVLQAMRAVPRHRFVPAEYRYAAYADCPLPIGYHQTISQPYIVALMTQLLELQGTETVLEIGTCSGYQAAVLAHLVQTVHTIERHASLAESARQVLEELNILNVQVHVGDGTRGLPKYAPFQGILVTAASPQVPQPLLEQLNELGRLVLPVGSSGNQVLQRWRRHGPAFEHEAILPVAFVPLIGEFGWKMED